MNNTNIFNEYMIFNRLDIGENRLKIGVNSDNKEKPYIVIDSYIHNEVEFPQESYYCDFVSALEAYAYLIENYADELAVLYDYKEVSAAALTDEDCDTEEEILPGMLCAVQSEILSPDKRSPDYQLVHIVAELNFEDVDRDRVYIARFLIDDSLAFLREDEIIGSAISDLVSNWVAQRYSESCTRKEPVNPEHDIVMRDYKFLGEYLCSVGDTEYYEGEEYYNED